MAVVGEVMQLVTEMRLETQKFRSEIAESQNRVSSFASFASKTLFAIGGAGIATLAFSKLKENIAEANARMETLYDNAQKLKIGVAPLQELEYAAKKLGLSSGTAVTVLQKMQQAIGNAEINGDGGAFAALGISVKELASLSPEQQLMKIGSALKDVKNQTQEAALAQQIFGKGAKDALRFIDSDLAAASAQYRSFGVGITDENAAMIDRLGDARDDLETMWEGFGNQLSIAVAPALIDAKERMVEFLKEGGGIKGLANDFGQDLATGINLGTTALEDMLAAWRKLRNAGAFIGGKIADVTLPNPTTEEKPGSSMWGNLLKFTERLTGNETYDTNDHLVKNGGDSFIASIKNQIGVLPTIISVVDANFKEVSTAAGKAGKDLTDFAAASKKAKDDMFTSALGAADGTGDQIARIIAASDQKPIAVDTDFDQIAGNILTDLQQGSDPNGANIQSNFGVLQGIIDSNAAGGMNVNAETQALKQLKEFANKQKNQSVDVNIKVEPTPYAMIEWSTSSDGKKALGDATQDYLNEQARSTYE